MDVAVHSTFPRETRGPLEDTRANPHRGFTRSLRHAFVGQTTTTWADFSVGWRAAALLTVTISILAAGTERVPVASGLATALLVAAAMIDLREGRLPNSIVLAAGAVFVATLVVEITVGRSVRADHIAIGAAAMSGPLLTIHVIAPLSMGFGDVKAAFVLGAATGAVDWSLAVGALAVASGATALVGLAARRRTIAFGPGLVAGTALVLAAHGALLAPLETTTGEAPGNTLMRTHTEPIGDPHSSAHRSAST